MHSLRQSSYIIQGNRINFTADHHLTQRISEFVGFLYQGDASSHSDAWDCKFRIVDKLRSVPPDSVKVMDGAFVTYYRSGDHIHIVGAGGSCIIMDPEKCAARGYIIKPDSNESADDFHPVLGAFIVEAMKHRGFYFMHGAGLYGQGKGYLITGRSNSGKSTITLNMIHQGFQYVSDDSMFIREVNGDVLISPFKTVFFMDERMSSRFEEIQWSKEKARKLSKDVWKKLPVEMFTYHPGSFIPSVRPDIMLFVNMVSNGNSLLRPMSHSDVYGRLLTRMPLAIDNRVSRCQVKTLEKLVKQTDVFELLHGRDVFEDPSKLMSILNEVSHRDSIN